MSQSPFKFLDAYRNNEKDKASFFGREKEISLLYDKVFESNLLLLYGGTGTGKTSLVSCGLAKKFEPSDWFPLFIRRGENLPQTLEDWIHKRSRSPMPRLQFNAEGNPEPVPIGQKIRRLYLDYYKPIYLIFDQFEELYIFGDFKEQELFYTQILEILNTPVQCRIIIVMREEFLAQLSSFERRLPTLFDNRFRLEKMTDLNIKEVILGTLKKVGNMQIEQEDVVSEAILNNLRAKPNERIELTNLQVYFDRLYREEIKRKGTDTQPKIVDLDLVNRVGPLQNVLANFLEEQVQELESDLESNFKFKKKGTPMEILFEFVTAQQTKQSIDDDRLISQYIENKKVPEGVVRYCIDYFQRSRILNALDE